MILFSISTLEDLNDIAYQSLLTPTPRYLPFTDLSAWVIYNSQFKDFRKSVLNGQSNEDYIDSIDPSVYTYDVGHNAELTALSESYCANATDVFFYPFGKKEFILDFFSSLIPTLAESLYEMMNQSGRIVQIGTGNGKALVIRPSEFTETHLSSLPQLNDPLSSLQTIMSSIQDIQNFVVNFNYILQIIDAKDSQINELTQKIKDLDNKVYSMYQTTWR